MFSFLNTNKEEISILIDVGNGTMTGSVVIFQKDKKPKFIYVVKNIFSISEKIESNKLELEMNSLLEKTIEMIVKKVFDSKYWIGKRKKIDRVMLSLSSPCFVSKTKLIKLSNNKEFIITENFIDDVVSKEIISYKNELSEEYREESFEVIEKSIVHGKINGYVLKEAFGKNTKNFDASLYLSVVHDTFLKNIINTIQKGTHLSKDKIHIHTFPLIAFSVIRDLFTKEKDFIFMDITSEITDITLVKNDTIDKTVSIPSGKNFIVRQISKNLNISPEIAESTLKLFINNKLDEQNHLIISDILNIIEKEWSIHLENALVELSPEILLPKTLFLTLDHDFFMIYNNFLNNPKIDATSLFRNNLKISVIDLEKLNLFYENQTGFVLDEFIVLISIFYNKILKENN